MHLVIFEDSDWHAFAPFSLSRPVFSLASGMTTLLRKQIRHLRPERVTLWVRPEFEAYCRQRVAPETGLPTLVNVPLDDQPAILLNGRLAFSRRQEIPSSDAVAIDDQGTIRAARITQPNLRPVDALEKSDRWRSLVNLPAMACGATLMHSPVDLIYWNEQSLIDDFAFLEDSVRPHADGPYYLVNDSEIRLGVEATISPGCVLDAGKGPISIGPRASIGANSVIQGPCWIGPGATVAPLSTIRPGTSIGAMCKVGGEISASIFHGYSNKSHEGFLGHTYIGKWVNLGAGTTTSNLKNTYGPITLKRGNREISTGRRFLGALLGDHSKTAILTRLMGGTYIGYCAMLAGSTIAPRFLPSFSFWTDKETAPYERAKAIEVAQRVFTRRDRIWTETDEQIMNYVAQAAPRIET